MEHFKPSWKNNDGRADVLPYPFSLQPLLLLLLEVFLPLNTLLLRLLPGFSLSLLFLKYTQARITTTVLMLAVGGETKFSQNDMPLRNKGVVALSNYCLQPQKRHFSVALSQNVLFSSFTGL